MGFTIHIGTILNSVLAFIVTVFIYMVVRLITKKKIKGKHLLMIFIIIFALAFLGTLMASRLVPHIRN